MSHLSLFLDTAPDQNLSATAMLYELVSLSSGCCYGGITYLLSGSIFKPYRDTLTCADMTAEMQRKEYFDDDRILQ
jgi:hypothetical protein